ncbi:MAG: threonine-phosphate decarboxylase [Magnetococcales bacterium]|nr:threonine-phosphate decarboxylase [Magnetococcales bacterium]
MLEHGGGVRKAALRFGIPLEAWLDLSTGINPLPRPPKPLPVACWQRLPEDGDGLEEAAAACYGTTRLLPLAGSQAAIQLLPRLRPAGRVAVLHPTYAEHAHAWRMAGHRVERVTPAGLDAASEPHDAVVVVNPNNPTGACLSNDRLLAWHARLQENGGWLVVDEAFMDATPEASLSPLVGLPGLIVLRSLGKFFGLAGARVGFLLADAPLLEMARERLGPWSVSGPARHVARLALADRPWQEETRRRLHEASSRLATLLDAHHLTPAGGTALFQWVPGPEAACRWERLAEQGILTRRFDDPPGLRFGLPGAPGEWERLALALARA